MLEYLDRINVRRIQTRVLSTGSIKIDFGGASSLRGHREIQSRLVGFPVAFVGILPLPKPVQAVLHVANFVFVNLLQNVGSCLVANPRKHFGKVLAIVEIGLFESEAQPRHEIHWRLHRRDDLPKLAAHRVSAKFDAAVAHAIDIHLRMSLLLLQRHQHASSKRMRSVWELQ